MYNINSFKSNGLRYNGARPSQFVVRIFPPFASNESQKIEFMVKAASLPASTVDSIDVGYFGRKIKVSGDRVFSDWMVDVYNDANFNLRAIFEKWSNQINTHISNRMDDGVWPQTYKQTAEVIQGGQEGSILRSYRFVGLFPTEIGDIRLDWDATNQIETFPVRFAYDYWELVEQGMATDTYNAVLPDDGSFSGNPGATV